MATIRHAHLFPLSCHRHKIGLTHTIDIENVKLESDSAAEHKFLTHHSPQILECFFPAGLCEF